MTRKLLPLLLIFCSSLYGFAQESDFSNYRWTNINAKGEAKGRHENAFIEYKGKFYLLGGRGINPVNVFDPETETWETKGKSPMEIHHFQAVVYGDAIYMVGAMGGPYPKEKPLANVWIYYPETDKWEKGHEIPKERRRGGSGAVVYNNKIYIACGIDYGHTSGTNNYFDCYNPRTGEWTVLTKAPHIRDHFPAIVVDDKLYCIGGRNTSYHTPKNFSAFFNAVVPEVDVYDFKQEKWYTLEEHLPVPTAAGGIVNMGDCLIYIGGEGSRKQAYNETQCLNLKSGKWTQLSTLTIGRHGSGAILHNNKIYIAAGSQNKGGGNMNSMEVFSSEHNWQSLFDGESLKGWSVQGVNEDEGKNFWSVKNGVIECNSMENKNHQYNWLITDKEYADFELRLRFQAASENKGNAGIQFRSRYDKKAKVDGKFKGWMDGPQVDIHPNGPWRNGYIYDETRSAKRWIYPSLPNWNISKEEYAPKRVNYYKEGEQHGWNDLLITCKGMQVRTMVNNVVVTNQDFTGILDNKEHQKRNVGSVGHIALQLHKNNENLIRFKDIEIRELKD